MRRLQVGHWAIAEIQDAARRYEAQRQGLGDELLIEVQRVLALLEQYPQFGVTLTSDLRARQVPLRRFPYRLIYRFDVSDFVVVALAHTSRRPGYWRDRL